MKKSKILILLLAMIMIVSISAVSAAEDIADSTDLAVSDDFTPLEVDESIDDVQADSESESLAEDPVETGNFTSLQSLIDQDDVKEVTLDKNYARVAEDKNIVINKDVTIDGQGKYTIDAKSLGRIFKVNAGSTLTLKGLTLTNGFSAKSTAGAIYVASGAALKADHVNFIDNVAYTRGAAIYSEGTVEVDHCLFDGNDNTKRNKNEDNGGAAIYNLAGTLTVNNSEFTNNLKNLKLRGANGAKGDLINAIITSTGETNIYNSVFENNSGCYGGAVCVLPMDESNPSLTMDNCNFTNNTAYAGGAVYIAGGSVAYSISNCAFENNLVAGNGSAGYTAAGGAIGIVLNPTSGSIVNCTFKNNNAKDGARPHGGAVAISGSSATIEGCVFEDNYASANGGAVSINNHRNGDVSPVVKIADSNFTNNNAAKTGGAVYVGNESDVEVSGSNFIDNKASDGSAVYNRGALTVSNNNFGENDTIESETDVVKDGSKVTIDTIENVTYGNPVVVYYNIENRTNNVTVAILYNEDENITYIDEAFYTVDYDKVTIINLPVNMYGIVIVNNADNNYARSFEVALFNVTKAVPTFDANYVVDEFGEIFVTATVNEDATMFVSFKVDDGSDYEEIEDGVAKYRFKLYDKDTHNLTVIYEGDDNYLEASKNLTVTLTKDVPVIEIINASVNEYGAIVVNANITKGVSGNVTLSFRDTDTNKTLIVPIAIGENGTIGYDELEAFEKGFYDVEITYDGDDKNYAANVFTWITIDKTAISPSTTYLNVTGGEVNVTVDLGVPATGNVSVVYPSGYVDNVTIVDGKVNIYNTFMTEQGNLSFVLDYTGDDNYYGFYEYYVDFFIKYDSDLKVDAKVNEFGQIVIDATVNKTASGNITFIIKNADTNETINLTVAVENGAASFDELTQFEKGSYEIEVDYSGDEIFADAQNAINTVNITKDVSVIEIINATVDEFGHIVVNANITNGTTGNVILLFFNLDTEKNMTVSIAIGENGTIEYSEIAPLDKGYYNVQIGYDGDANYYAVAENAQADVNVTKTVPSMNYAVKVVGGEVNIAITLPSNINGKLTVIYPSGYNETVNITNGSASIYNTFITETGDLAINVSFAGNDQYYAVEKSIPFVIKQATLIKTSPVSVVYKNNAKVTVKLTNLVTDKAIDGAPIEITVNGKTYKGTTDKDGNAVITIPANMIPKKYVASVSYKGTDRLESDLDEFTLTVKKATPKITAKKKTFKKSKKVKKYTITLKDNKGKAIKKAKVTIKVGKKTFKAKTNAKGKAVFKLKKLTKKAKYKAKVTFKGNKYFNKVTKKAKIIIK